MRVKQVQSLFPSLLSPWQQPPICLPSLWIYLFWVFHTLEPCSILSFCVQCSHLTC